MFGWKPGHVTRCGPVAGSVPTLIVAFVRDHPWCTAEQVRVGLNLGRETTARLNGLMLAKRPVLFRERRIVPGAPAKGGAVWHYAVAGIGK